jgi:hypothetical protein
MSQHEDMAAFFDDLYRAVHGCLSSGAFDAVRRRDKRGIIDHAVSCLVLELAQAPYIFSLFHQNKDRIFVETLERQANATARPGGHPCAAAADPANRPMRVLLFTDTYADVNGAEPFHRQYRGPGRRDRPRPAGVHVHAPCRTRRGGT